MSRKRPKLDDGATFVGILLGLVIGSLWAQTRIKRKGAIRRKDLTQFGAGTAEIEIEASLREAKRRAKARQEAQN